MFYDEPERDSHHSCVFPFLVYNHTRDSYFCSSVMGKAKKTRKVAEYKRMLSPKDPRLKENQEKMRKKHEKEKESAVVNIPQVASSLFFKYNTALGPPYHVIVDTNFINFSIQNKLELVQAMMDCLVAKCNVCFRLSFVLL